MAAPMSGRVFISYRRQETAWPARQLYELLASRFGADKIFKDVDNIQPGEDFVEKIGEAVASCDVLLALIGPQWLEAADETGARRLDDPDDFVRIEITTALTRGVLVIPILVDGARMPPASRLPGELVPLTRRQAVEINPVGFNTDRLLAALTEALNRPPAASAAATAAAPAAAASTPMTAEPSAPLPQQIAVEPPPAVPPPIAEESQPRPVTPPTPVTQSPPMTQSPPLSPTTHVTPIISRPAGPGGPAAPGAVGPTGGDKPAGNRLWPAVGAAVAAVALIATIVVWHPWAPTGTTSGGTVSGGPATPSIMATTPPPVTSAPPTTATPPATPTESPPAELRPQIVAHRGGLEKHQFETQQAMEAAALAGYWVETDLRYTSDGVAVLVHDEEATRGLDCGGSRVLVSQTTWSVLRKTCRSKPSAADRKTYEIPRFENTMEAIAAASPSARVLVEIKTQQTSAQRKAFLDVFAKYGLHDRAVVTSFNRSYLAAIRKEDASVSRLLFVSKQQIPAADLKKDGLWAVAVEQSIATKKYVDQLQQLGLRVMIWVVNDPGQWADAVKLNPDLLMTAYPGRFEDWLKSR